MKQMIKKLAVVLSVALVYAPIGAMAVDKLIVQDVNNQPRFVVSDTGNVISVKNAAGNNMLVVTDAGKIGIGITPGASNSGFTIKTTDQFMAQISNQLTSDTKAASAGMLFMKAKTTGAPLIDERLGYIIFGGVDANTTPTARNTAGIVGYAESPWTTTTFPTFLAFETTQFGGRSEKLRVTGSGNVGIGTINPKSKLHVVGIPVYTTNAAAITGGLTAGAFYRTGADPDVLCVVH